MRTRLAIAVAATALLLAACGSSGRLWRGDPAAGPAPTPVPAETAKEPLVTPEPEPEPTPEEDDRYGEKVLNDRGNLVKAIGQLAGLTNADGVVLADFTITAIEPNFVCTNEYAQPSEHGQFIAVSLDVTTSAELAQEDWPTFTLSEYDFKVFSPDGTRENDSTGAAYSCLADAEQLPMDIGPGEHAVGKIVLDSAHPTGSLAIVFAGAPGGWEWGY